jgi:hypothetical protein
VDNSCLPKEISRLPFAQPGAKHVRSARRSKNNFLAWVGVSRVTPFTSTSIPHSIRWQFAWLSTVLRG